MLTARQELFREILDYLHALRGGPAVSESKAREVLALQQEFERRLGEIERPALSEEESGKSSRYRQNRHHAGE